MRERVDLDCITLSRMTLLRQLRQMKIIKERLQSVLRIGSAHNKGGLPDINIVQISLVYIIYKHSKPAS